MTSPRSNHSTYSLPNVPLCSPLSWGRTSEEMIGRSRMICRPSGFATIDAWRAGRNVDAVLSERVAMRSAIGQHRVKGLEDLRERELHLREWCQVLRRRRSPLRGGRSAPHLAGYDRGSSTFEKQGARWKRFVTLCWPSRPDQPVRWQSGSHGTPSCMFRGIKSNCSRPSPSLGRAGC